MAERGPGHETGRLVQVATPIGNLGDLSPRAAAELEASELWFVEDSRVSARLQAHLGLKRPMRVVNEHSTEAQLRKNVEDLSHGLRAALLTDGGCPGVSDPGARLADLCHEAGVEVDAAPGPSAVTTALMLSGFYAQRFVFLGFLPRKPGPMRAELEAFCNSSLTLVLFESPFRTEKLLGTAFEALGPRRYALCREMTKLHQQIYRGRLPELPGQNEVPGRGEFTVVFEGRRKGLDVPGSLW